MKKNYQLQWTSTSVEYLADEHYAHLFMLVRNGRIIYIGNCFRRNVQQLVANTVQAVSIDSAPVEVYLGRIVEFARLSDEEVQHMVGMLVYARKPIYNLKGKRDFVPTDEMYLHISGTDLFPEVVRANTWGVFLSQRAAVGIYATA